MLDPSCSGSGIVNSPDRWMEETSNGDNKKDEKRIQSLSNFQLVALKHSMQFPNVDRIVYSTCSVHDEENEMVVSKALSEIEKPDNESEEWVLLPPVCLQHWKRRGKEGIGGLNKEQADCLVRCDGLDGDGKRHTILQERMNQLVPSISEGSNKVAVEPIHGDFLRSDPSDPKFANVKAIMLDPSCSGSGIVNSPDRWMEETSTNGDNKKDEKRIQSLSNFQLVALKHSMQFPNVDRIVYSTCSVHDEENEMVVSKALSEIEKPDNESEEWVLLPPVCLQHWKRRGKEGIGGLNKEQADCLVRCDGLDGDGKRHTILQERMNQLVPSISEGSNKVAVEPIHGDFLRSDPTDPQFAM